MHLFNKNKLARERLKSKREPTKKEDKNAVSIIRKGPMREESILGHIPKNICKSVSIFLTLFHSSMEANVTAKRINCGGS